LGPGSDGFRQVLDYLILRLVMAGCDILHKLRQQLLVCVWVPYDSAARKWTEFEKKFVNTIYN